MFKTQIISTCLVLCSLAVPQAIAQTAASSAKSAQASAASKAKTENFPKQIQVEGVKLNLNGQGTRYKAVFQVYDMGLYTPSKARTMQDVINAPGPKKLEFVALRDISTSELGVLFYRGIKDNSTPAQYLKHATAALRLSEIASGRHKILTGESFSMEFVPGKGLTFLIADKPQGAPIGDAEFFSLVLGIWLGPVPADFRLKDALLNAQ